MANSEISIPFQLNTSGTFAKTSTDDGRVRLHFLSLLNTEPGERVVFSNYGVPLSSLLFETGVSRVREMVVQDVISAAKYWEPGIMVAKGQNVPLNEQDSLVLMNLTYSRADSAVDNGNRPAHSNTVILGPGGVLNQQVRG